MVTGGPYRPLIRFRPSSWNQRATCGVEGRQAATEARSMYPRRSLAALVTAVAVTGCAIANGDVAAPTASERPLVEERRAATQSPVIAGPTAAEVRAQASPAHCPVTVPDDPGFVAPTPDPAVPPVDYASRWYGTPGLWTMLSTAGESWHSLPRDGRVRGQKTFWWSAAWDTARELEPAIVVTGRRLDGPAPEVRAGDPGTNATADFGTAMLVGVGLPTRGLLGVARRATGPRARHRRVGRRRLRHLHRPGPSRRCPARVLGSPGQSSVTPCGREAGEIPAQSRYGERPSGRKSGRRPTVHARTFERKVGRTVRSTG